MSVKVCVINGAPGSGKTTFENICREKCNMFQRVPGFNKDHMLWIDICSTVDFVKDLALECGWDGTKTLKNRKFLSDLKDLLTEWDDVPFKKIEERAQLRAKDASAVDWILFVDCREPAEIQKLKERLNAITVLIRRPGDEETETSNHADAGVFDYDYDLNIYNEYGLDELEMLAKEFIDYLRGVSDYEYDY